MANARCAICNREQNVRSMKRCPKCEIWICSKCASRRCPKCDTLLK